MNFNFFDRKISIGAKNAINKGIDNIDNVLEEQNEVLNEYRKEGHLYRVSENINGRVFLWDITDKPDFEVEEVDFPEELISKATEGAVFQYINGKYEFYSNDGFEM